MDYYSALEIDKDIFRENLNKYMRKAYGLLQCWIGDFFSIKGHVYSHERERFQ